MAFPPPLASEQPSSDPAVVRLLDRQEPPTAEVARLDRTKFGL